MCHIQPYDLSQSFKLIPDRKKYSLLFYTGNSVEFTSKRQAFNFYNITANALKNYETNNLTLFNK